MAGSVPGQSTTVTVSVAIPRSYARRATSRSRASLKAGLSDSTAPMAPAPCSAWARTSAATHEGSDPSSATIRTSLGPARLSIATSPMTWRFASATKRFPGPTMMSQRGTDAVP